jgi:hypothetical protein
MTEFFTPFGPTIMRVDIPSEYIDKLNEYMDEVVNDEKLSIEKEYRPNLVGHIELEKRVVISDAPGIWQNMNLQGWFYNQIEKYVSRLTDDRGELVPNSFEITSAWINDMVEHEWNPIHEHAPSLISMIAYLKVPDCITEENIDGLITWLDGRQQKFVKTGFVRLPKVGDCYFFPGWLSHTVMPFKGEGIRRSMSANIHFNYRDYGPQQF